ncbi:MAG TPA: hypothetical protein VFT80_10880 [Actinomycetota bacterium]|nr:hypothetical protein [Actinomycetota bacterium]
MSDERPAHDEVRSAWNPLADLWLIPRPLFERGFILDGSRGRSPDQITRRPGRRRTSTPRCPGC